MPDTLADARDALEQHAWMTAYETLKALDEERSLEPENLARLGEAAWWVGRMDDCIDARSRAFAGYTAAGEKTKAGLLCLSLAEDHFHRLEGSIGRGWLARADRLLSEDEGSSGFGWLARTRSVIAYESEGNLDKALHWAEIALKVAAAVDDSDLHAISLHDKGRALVAQGEIDEGMRLMEEAMVGAVGGELGALVTGRIYCNMIDLCEKLADYRRAAEWDEAARRWCERVGNKSGFPGICRVKRAEIMLLRGKWEEAEGEALRATEELAHFLDFAAVGFKEIGEIRLRMGDLQGAERAFLEANELGHNPQPGLALLRLAQGDVEGAGQMMTSVLADESVIDLQRAKLLPALVEVALAADDMASAEEAAAEAKRLADSFGSRGLLAAAAYSAGGVALSRGQLDSAIEESKRAWRLWSEEDLPYEAARARAQLGLAYRAQGATALADMELDAASKTFRSLGARLDVARLDRLTETTTPVRTVWTMMFTDIVGSTDLIRTIGDSAWTQLASWHDRTLRRIFESHGGREKDHAGDGFFVLFPSASEAVACAVEIQQTLQLHRAEAGFAPQVRIGIHLAEVNEAPGVVTGLEVHTAARIGSLASAGEIVLSADVAAQVGPDVSLSEPFQAEVKGVLQPLQVVKVNW